MHMLNRIRPLSVLVAMVLASILLAGASLGGPVRDGTDAHGSMGNPAVFPPNSSLFGKSYGDWGAEWWKWALSIPMAVNPMNDQTGANSTQGQSGPVWFLAGTFCPDINVGCTFATATRTCTVPIAMPIFFPIINSECSVLEGNGTTEAELLACAQGGMNGVTQLECDLDGVSVGNLFQYRAHSGLYTFGPLPDGNIFQSFGLNAPAGTTSQSVQDGFYIMLKPLTPGAHTLHFLGNIPGSFGLEVTYHLTAGSVAQATVGPDRATPARPSSWGRLKTMYR